MIEMCNKQNAFQIELLHSGGNLQHTFHRLPFTDRQLLVPSQTWTQQLCLVSTSECAALSEEHSSNSRSRSRVGLHRSSLLVLSLSLPHGGVPFTSQVRPISNLVCSLRFLTCLCTSARLALVLHGVSIHPVSFMQNLREMLMTFGVNPASRHLDRACDT